MDWPLARQAADRIRATIPPEILSATEEGDLDAEDQLPIVQNQLTQARKNLEALNAHAANIEQQLQVTQDELKLTRMKQEVELRKAELDNMTRMREIDNRERETELDFYIKEQELLIQKEQLRIEESKLAIAGVRAASEIEDKVFDRAAQEVETNVRFNAPEISETSELKEPPEGLRG